MDLSHSEEIRQFERLLAQVGVGRVCERMAVVRAFLGAEGHLDAAGWHERLREDGVNLDPEFVEDTLELMVRLGLASRRVFDGGPPRYEHSHLGEHHDHLICTKCGSITEFTDPALEDLQLQVAKSHGFHHLKHRLQIYGLCANCLRERQPAMPLNLASPGERLKVVRMVGGEQAQQYLLDQGLTIGAELDVISAGGGPVVVAIRGSRLALGRGAAQKIMVCPLEHHHHAAPGPQDEPEPQRAECPFHHHHGHHHEEPQAAGHRRWWLRRGGGH